MSRLFYHVMQDVAGNLLFGVSGTMRLAGSSTLATIYGDEDLTVILPNPMTNHPSFASFKCFLGAGDYDFHLAKAGYTFETLTGVQGYGTLAQQDANAVAITGGGATFTANIGIKTTPPTYELDVTGNVRVMTGTMGIGGLPYADSRLALLYPKSTGNGLTVQNTDADGGGGVPVLFRNQAGTPIGTIASTTNSVAYNTSSDERLKEAVEPLRDALATIQALAPVAFRWKVDGTPGQGFIAQDAQAHVPQAVVGDPDSAEPSMQMDHSKLVVWLVGACQELAQQVQTLTARLAVLEGS